MVKAFSLTSNVQFGFNIFSLSAHTSFCKLTCSTDVLTPHFASSHALLTSSQTLLTCSLALLACSQTLLTCSLALLTCSQTPLTCSHSILASSQTLLTCSHSIFKLAYGLAQFGYNYEITPEPSNSSLSYHATNCPSVIADCGSLKVTNNPISV